MRIRLSDVVPEEELTARVEALVHDILDRVITIEMYEGPVKRQKKAPAPLPAEPIVCPECGKSDFRNNQALAGHLFHKHGIRLHEGEVVSK